jgi:hypothetical protein
MAVLQIVDTLISPVLMVLTAVLMHQELVLEYYVPSLNPSLNLMEMVMVLLPVVVKKVKVKSKYKYLK